MSWIFAVGRAAFAVASAVMRSISTGMNRMATSLSHMFRNVFDIPSGRAASKVGIRIDGVRLNINQSAIDNLVNDRALIPALEDKANQVLSRAQSNAPSWSATSGWTWYVRSGVGPRGAYAQAVARGSGTVAAEYGGSRSPAYAYMRRAL